MKEPVPVWYGLFFHIADFYVCASPGPAYAVGWSLILSEWEDDIMVKKITPQELGLYMTGSKTMTPEEVSA